MLRDWKTMLAWKFLAPGRRRAVQRSAWPEPGGGAMPTRIPTRAAPESMHAHNRDRPTPPPLWIARSCGRVELAGRIVGKGDRSSRRAASSSIAWTGLNAGEASATSPRLRLRRGASDRALHLLRRDRLGEMAGDPTLKRVFSLRGGSRGSRGDRGHFGAPAGARGGGHLYEDDRRGARSSKGFDAGRPRTSRRRKLAGSGGWRGRAA